MNIGTVIICVAIWLIVGWCMYLDPLMGGIVAFMGAFTSTFICEADFNSQIGGTDEE